MPISFTLAQLTPPMALPVFMREFMTPIPMMDPNRVWELDAGRTSHQVPRFQSIAEIKSEKTIANPAALPTFMTNSTGSRLITPNATAPDDTRTPMRFQRPDQTTATPGFKLWV